MEASCISLPGVGRVPFVSRRAPLKLSASESEKLTALSQSRTRPVARVQRAATLLRYQSGETTAGDPPMTSYANLQPLMEISFT
jgi:hypothetical protein